MALLGLLRHDGVVQTPSARTVACTPNRDSFPLDASTPVTMDDGLLGAQSSHSTPSEWPPGQTTFPPTILNPRTQNSGSDQCRSQACLHKPNLCEERQVVECLVQRRGCGTYVPVACRAQAGGRALGRVRHWFSSHFSNYLLTRALAQLLREPIIHIFDNESIDNGVGQRTQ